jgi:cytochrome c-type biogenesis protein CcmE
MTVLIAIIISTYGSSSTSASFAQAENNPNKEFQISGDLMLDKPMIYDPLKNANYFSFYLKDKDGTIFKVESNEPKPQDFEYSDKVVAIGKAKGGVFKANKLLLKCPSKYEKDEEIGQNYEKK